MNAMFELLRVATPYALGFWRVANIFDSGKNVVNILRNDPKFQRRETISNLAVESLCLAAHSTTFAISYTPLNHITPARAKLLSNLLSSGAAVSKQVSVRGWNAETLCIILIASDACSDTVFKEYPQIFSGKEEQVKQQLDIAEGFAFLIMSFPAFVKAGKNLHKLILCFLQMCHVMNRPRAFATAVNEGSITASADQECSKKSLENMKAAIYSCESQIKEIRDLDQLTSIPSFLESDTTLNKYICPLTGKCIRFVFIPKDSEEDEIRRERRRPVFYEEHAIKDWIANHPATAPKGWPEHLPPPASVKSIRHCSIIQMVIDSRIDEIREKMEKSVNLILKLQK